MSIRPFEILLADPQGFLRHGVTVDLHRKHDRRTTPVEDIDGEWARRTAQNPALFNGAKFRLSSLRLLPGQAQEPVLEIGLGITDYRSLIGTNLSPAWRDILQSGDAAAVADPAQPAGAAGAELSGRGLANALGNAAVIETADGHVVLLRRSSNVGECPLCVVVPGGHPEPHRVGIDSLAAWRAGAVASSDSVADELFKSIVEEVLEETGLLAEELGPPRLLGFIRRSSGHRPVVIFHMHCALAAAAVIHRYETGVVADRGESLAMFTLPADDLLRQVLDEDSLEMPGCHRGGLALFRQHRLARPAANPAPAADPAPAPAGSEAAPVAGRT